MHQVRMPNLQAVQPGAEKEKNPTKVQEQILLKQQQQLDGGRQTTGVSLHYSLDAADGAPGPYLLLCWRDSPLRTTNASPIRWIHSNTIKEYTCSGNFIFRGK